MLQKVIENQKYLSRILNESQENMNHAENYMHQKIEEMYPEICKAIQHRRAQYFLLVHEYHYVEKMMKNGQIEDKEASQLKSEIDYKIFNLQLNPPEIILAD